jgi:hypothetical protein
MSRTSIIASLVDETELILEGRYGPDSTKRLYENARKIVDDWRAQEAVVETARVFAQILGASDALLDLDRLRRERGVA